LSLGLHVVMCFKSFEEFVENLGLSLSALDDIWVLAGIVHVLDVFIV
jgi:hypothetical protein